MCYLRLGEAWAVARNLQRDTMLQLVVGEDDSKLITPSVWRLRWGLPLEANSASHFIIPASLFTTCHATLAPRSTGQGSRAFQSALHAMTKDAGARREIPLLQRSVITTQAPSTLRQMRDARESIL